MARRSFRNLVAILLLAGVYFAAGRFGLSWARINPSASAVWPPTGIALAFLPLRGYRLLPGVLLLVLLAVAQLVFFGRTPFGGKNAPLEYLAILPLLWASFRFDQRGAITASFIFSAIALWGTLRGLGPFATPDANESLLLLQSFMGIMTITGLVMASLNSERKRAEQRLQLQDAISRGLAESASLSEATPKIFQALFEIGGWEVGAVWK